MDDITANKNTQHKQIRQMQRFWCGCIGFFDLCQQSKIK